MGEGEPAPAVEPAPAPTPPTIKIYISGNSGSKEITNAQHRITMILKSLGFPLELVDISAPGMEEKRDVMRESAKKKEGQRHALPPQIYNGEKYCGDYDDFDVANEDDVLEEFLGLPKKAPKVPKGSGEFPVIKSVNSLVAKHVTKERWDKVKDIETKTCGFTLAKACACAIEFDNQHCGIYAGDWDCYKDFSEIFDAIIQDYHGISPDAKHTSDMDVNKVTGNIDPAAPVHSTRIRVGRSIDGFGLSPGITKQQRIDVEKLMSSALSKLTDDLAGNYYPLTGMDEAVRQQLVDDHFLFVSGDRNLTVAGMERDWPEGRGIFHNAAKTFLLWVNEEDQMRIISMEKGGDVKGVFGRLARGIKAVGDSVKAESGKEFALSEQYGFIRSCPTNLGTGMRASVHVDLPGYTKEGLDALKKRCEELAVQPRGTRGESGGQTGFTYDVSNKHRLGYSEVQLIQTMIDGCNTLWKEDQELQKKHGI